MEKILLAADALNPDVKSLDFAGYLSRLTKSKITGIFLENFAGINQFEHEQINDQVEKNIALFKQACTTREVSCNLHHDRGQPADAIITESRYADLIVMPAGISFSNQSEGNLTHFVSEVLQKAECPVIIAPETFTGIEELVFAYDGSASSMVAMKMFTYLFPQWENKKTTILQVNETGEWNDVNKYKLKEWLKNHYTDLHFEAHKAESEYGLFDCILKKQKAFIILGAYGKSHAFSFFKPSQADFLIKTIDHPIFIAHL